MFPDYNNESEYKNIYGGLYNWYTVNTGNLCPTGWSVPGEEEWKILIDYLGGESVAGGKLKGVENAHWFDPNTNADNSSGFTALPGGYRYHSNGYCGDLMAQGILWLATEYSDTKAMSCILYSNSAGIQMFHGNKKNGYSVRCLKD